MDSMEGKGRTKWDQLAEGIYENKGRRGGGGGAKTEKTEIKK